MYRKLLILAVFLILAVTVVGVMFVLSLPEINVQAQAFQATYPVVPTLSGATLVPTTQVPTVAPTSMVTQAPTQAGATATPQPTVSAVPTSIPGTGGFQYVVQAGDTLSSIAVKYNVSLAAIIAANPQLTNPNLIFPGQVVNVPGTSGGSSTPGVPPTGGTGGFYYVVQSGETLSTIAQKYNVTVVAILGSNPQITNPNLIFPGQVIFIPNGSNSGPGVPPTGGGSTYVVQPGDTLSAIAAKYSTTVNALLAANPQITNANLIFPGQVIQLPGGTVPPTGGNPNTYVVQAGDTLGAIAVRYNVTLQALLAANPQITNANFILPGQVITIPSGGTVPPTGGDPNSYTVVAGDTLSGIAAANATTVQNLLALNTQITNANLIFPGQVIKLR